jgi:molecular chaperone DnaK
VKIIVLQGESDRAEENELLGEFILTGLRRAPRAEVEIEVTFEISSEGIVSVSAKDLETGQQQSITVTATSGLTEDEIKEMARDSEEYLVEARTTEEFERNKQAVERVIGDLEEMFPKVQEIIAGSDFGQDAVKKARTVINRARTAVEAQDLQGVIESSESLTRTLNMFKSVVQKIG